MPFSFGIDASGNYGYKKAGADTVTPFKKGYEDTPGTATAAQITKGYTAWVNGVKITGTRSAQVSALTGSFEYSLLSMAQTTQLVSFSPPFDNIPKVTVVTHNEPSVVATVSSITRSSCVITVKNTTGDGFYNKTCNWSAEAQ